MDWTGVESVSNSKGPQGQPILLETRLQSDCPLSWEDRDAFYEFIRHIQDGGAGEEFEAFFNLSSIGIHLETEPKDRYVEGDLSARKSIIDGKKQSSVSVGYETKRTTEMMTTILEMRITKMMAQVTILIQGG